VFAHRKSETVKLDDLRVALHGQSFKTQEVTDDLAANYPKPVEGYFNIGVLHTAADGRGDHLPYAPCSVGELSAKGYDYWALGHVHKREILSDAPHIVFPGNLQGRHIRETALEGKGCTLVSVDEGGKATLSHEPVDTVRWNAVTVDVSGVETMGALVDRARNELIKAHDEADGRILAARVTVAGDTRFHGWLLLDGESLLSEVRGAGMDVAIGEVWIEKVVVATQPTASLEDLSAYGGMLGDVARKLKELQKDNVFREDLTDVLKPLFEKLPAEVLERTPELQTMKDGGEAFEEVMRQASDIVVTRLAGVEIDE
jgi:DNA repair exonuclease SbcCD nuclease subunit